MSLAKSLPFAGVAGSVAVSDSGSFSAPATGARAGNRHGLVRAIVLLALTACDRAHAFDVNYSKERQGDGKVTFAPTPPAAPGSPSFCASSF